MITITLYVTMNVWISNVARMTDLARKRWVATGEDLIHGIGLQTTVTKTIKFTSEPLSKYELLNYIKAFNTLTAAHIERATTSTTSSRGEIGILDVWYNAKRDGYDVIEVPEEDND